MIDNLTEAIAHYKERARYYIETLKPFGDKPMLEATKKYIARQQEFARKYEQLAAWLEELAERREADRWIPVSERLPEKEGRCLVFTDYGDVTMDSYRDGMFVCNLGNVTHWRPLPKAPESEAKSLDYQRAVEDTEYCERHEPTYNPDDGSV